MAPLFSKVDSNKLRLDVQNEENVIFAKFGKDLYNISKVIGRKTDWPRFFGLPGIFNATMEVILWNFALLFTMKKNRQWQGYQLVKGLVNI